MDLATLIGLISGIIIIVGAIWTGGDLMIFVNLPSILIVCGCTFAATLIRFPLKTCFGAFKVALNAFRGKSDPPLEIIMQAVELAGVVRREGLLALEHQPVEDAFFAKGLRLCVDGLEPEFVRKVLTEEMENTVTRHEGGQQIFRAVGDAAPAMGMIGTLIGLVQMLADMNDPKAIGPAMATALLTTFYGAVIANLFALPIADKLAIRTEEEGLNKLLVIESIAAIQEGRNPRVMEELLMSYLPGQDGASPAAPAG
ncbi:MAG: MotA/TolQ/ExbB proton channel family protein [Myxococcota bacterium]|nr:MotA/TolQ/ExbB proton channel family protein [Myxococcota bacterium]